MSRPGWDLARLGLRSRPGLVSLRSQPKMDVATWLDWQQKVWLRDQGFGSRQGRFGGGSEDWSRHHFEVATSLGWRHVFGIAGGDAGHWCRDPVLRSRPGLLEIGVATPFCGRDLIYFG